MRKLQLLILFSLFALMAAACGGDDEEPTQQPEQQTAPTTEATEEAVESTAAPEQPTEEVSESAGGVTAHDTAWTCPEGFEGQTLSIYNWATFIGEETVAAFERLCNVTVNYDVYDSNESMIARLRQGNPGYDIGVPSDYAVSIMIRDGLIQPINLENIPNFANVIPEFTNKPFDPGNQYSVPYLWSTTGVAYNRTRVTEPITSWQQLFDYEGPVAWLEDPRTMLSFALLVLGHDPNSTDPDEINAARDFLIEHSGNVRAIAADDGDALLVAGEVDVAVEFNGDIFQQSRNCGCDDYVYVIPEEGAIQDVSNLVIFTDAPNPALAEVFMDFILDPYVAAEITNYTVYATVNQLAIDMGLIEPELLVNPAITPPQEALANLYFLQDVGDDIQFYNNAWDEVKIGVGQ